MSEAPWAGWGPPGGLPISVCLECMEMPVSKKPKKLRAYERALLASRDAGRKAHVAREAHNEAERVAEAAKQEVRRTEHEWILWLYEKKHPLPAQET